MTYRSASTCDEHDYCNKIVVDDVSIEHVHAPKGRKLPKREVKASVARYGFAWREVAVAVGISTLIEIVIKVVS